MMGKIKVFIKSNKKVVVPVTGLLFILATGLSAVLIQNSSAYKIELANLRAHGLNNYHEGNTFVKKQTVNDMQELLSSEIQKAEEFLAKVEETKLNEKYDVEVAETTPITIKAEEIETQIYTQQVEQKQILVTEATNIVTAPTKYNDSEKKQFEAQKTAAKEQVITEDDIFANEVVLKECSKITDSIKKIAVDAKKRIDKSKEAAKPKPENNTPAPSAPEYVDPGTGYNPPATGGSSNSGGGSTYTPPPANNTPAPSNPAPSNPTPPPAATPPPSACPPVGDISNMTEGSYVWIDGCEYLVDGNGNIVY